MKGQWTSKVSVKTSELGFRGARDAVRKILCIIVKGYGGHDKGE